MLLAMREYGKRTGVNGILKELMENERPMDGIGWTEIRIPFMSAIIWMKTDG